MRSARSVTVALVLAAVAFAGCSSSKDDQSNRSASSSGDAAPKVVTDEAVAGGAGGSGQAGGAASATGGGASVAPPNPVPDAAAAGPRIVKKADLTVDIRRDGLQAAVDRATSIAERHDGYVASTQVSRGDDASTGTLTVRVPAAQFDAARRELTGLGTVKDERMSGDDVTAQLVDYAARIASLQAQEEALRTLLGRANAVGEVLQVQQQLFDVRRQIEQLQGQQRALADAADFSTITLRLAEPGAPGRDTRPGGDASPAGLRRSLDRSWDAAVAVVGGVIVGLGVLVPLAVLALLVWLVGGFVLRRSIGRLRARATS